jgi:hypothetical protein
MTWMAKTELILQTIGTYRLGGGGWDGESIIDEICNDIGNWPLNNKKYFVFVKL